MARSKLPKVFWIVFILSDVIILGAVLSWHFGWFGKKSSAPAPGTAQASAAAQPSADAQSVATSQPTSAPVDTPQMAEAKKTFQRGLNMMSAGNLVDARQLLSEALAGGLLPGDQEDLCRARLTEIADKVVFSPAFFEQDPWAYRYVVQSGDVLVNIVKKENLDVPAEGVQLINRIADARTIRVGQKLKLVKGPFDAIVTKRTHTLDLYQHGMFVKTYRVGLGMNGSTPTGKWQVVDRVRQATWTPPPSSEDSRSIIYWGEAGYPLGKEGIWIALQGVDDNTRGTTGLGIHGTNEPESIGKDGSLGCVRLADADIEEVFSFMCPGKSSIEIRP